MRPLEPDNTCVHVHHIIHTRHIRSHPRTIGRRSVNVFYGAPEKELREILQVRKPYIGNGNLVVCCSPMRQETVGWSYLFIH